MNIKKCGIFEIDSSIIWSKSSITIDSIIATLFFSWCDDRALFNIEHFYVIISMIVYMCHKIIVVAHHCLNCVHFKPLKRTFLIYWSHRNIFLELVCVRVRDGIIFFLMRHQYRTIQIENRQFDMVFTWVRCPFIALSVSGYRMFLHRHIAHRLTCVSFFINICNSLREINAKPWECFV